MKEFLINAFYASSNNFLLKNIGQETRGPLTILMYHRISESIPSAGSYAPCDNLLNVSTDNFNDQIEYVSKNFHCLTMSEAVSKLISGSIKKNSLVITFDDGYIDNFTLAAPILKKHSVPAIFYICTDFPNRKANLWWYIIEALINEYEVIEFSWEGKQFQLINNTLKQKIESFSILVDLFISENLLGQRKLLELLLASYEPKLIPKEDNLMTWDQIIDISKEKIFEIGAHSVTHQVLKNASAPEVLDEMVGSKEIIEGRIGNYVSHFAYPFGYQRSASNREFNLARQAGFTSAVTTRFAHVYSAHKDALLALPRIPVTNMPLDHFKVRISGWEALVRQRGVRFKTD